MKDLISIIIPVYNGENTIERCLQSIVNQTYKNIQVIIVNDHSTDSTEIICKRYMKLYDNISYQNSLMSGVSNARNYGIEKASGKFITFVDADDRIHPDYCNDLYNSMINNEADLSICSFSVIKESKGFSEEEVHSVPFVARSKKEFGKHFSDLFKKNLINTLWNKMYVKNLIDFKMNENYKIGEDLLFNLNYLDRCNRIVFIDDILYYYYTYSQSPEKRLRYHNGRFQTLSKLYLQLKQHLVNNYGDIKIKENIYPILFRDIRVCLKDTMSINVSNKQKVNEIKDIVEGEYTIEICNMHYSLSLLNRLLRFLIQKKCIIIIFLVLKVYCLLF